MFAECRILFKNPDIAQVNDQSIEWKECNDDDVIKFLVEEKGFNSDRVKAGLKRLKDSKGKSNQQRLDSFFQSKPSTPLTPSTSIGKKKKTNSIGKKK
jgi:flap endonuclease-1